jgi:hypothetical protein
MPMDDQKAFGERDDCTVEAPERKLREDQVRRALGSVRWGAAFFAISIALLLLSRADWLPGGLITLLGMIDRAGFLVVAGIGIVSAVLGFLSLRATTARTDRARGQFEAAVHVAVGAIAFAFVVAMVTFFIVGLP